MGIIEQGVGEFRDPVNRQGYELSDPTIHADSLLFRRASLPRVHSELQGQLATLTEVLRADDPQQLSAFLISSAANINSAVLGASDEQNGTSLQNVVLARLLGRSVVTWTKPTNADILEPYLTNGLAALYYDDQIDLSRLALGAYFIQSLLHRRDNGNGRTARAVKLVFEKIGDSEVAITEDETSSILGIEAMASTMTDIAAYPVELHPDVERLILGVAYFAVHKGLAPYTAARMGLASKFPEEGLEDLSRELGVPRQHLTTEFIWFMTVESDLAWCGFGQESYAPPKKDQPLFTFTPDLLYKTLTD